MIIRAIKTFFSVALAALLILAANPETGTAGEKFRHEPFVPTDPIMPLSSVKPGMKGECFTVVKGSDIVSFNAEVIDIVNTGGNPRNLILIRVSGKVVEATGGIAAGMSGSPFYINRRLVGAIGYGWSFSDHFQGLVTPIEEMLEIWNNPEIIPSFGLAPVIAEEPPSKDIALPQPKSRRAVSGDITSGDAASGDEAPEDATADGGISGDTEPNDVVIEEILPASSDMPVSRDVIISRDVFSSADIRASWDLLVSRDKTISRDRTISRDIGISRGAAQGLFVSGVSKRMAASMIETLGAEALPFGGTSGSGVKSIRYDPKIRPGMAIGASILWGDVEMSSIGTLTAVSKDGRFIAYAHPFLNLGPTAAVLMDAHISNVIPSLNNSFKLGATKNIIGIVTQDRPQGIGGRIGQFAPAAS
ncbi:MAG: hypothetical protein LBU26_01010, partial [Synergistaceae bacterium]|nr:hypothetical protein [Synergistaceae bacterium]